jgi:hypothetical protein
VYKHPLRNLVLIAVVCAGGWGLVRLFSRWQERVPTPTHAATQVLGHPYLGDQETGIFHRRRCPAINPRGQRSTFPKKAQAEHLVGFHSRADAIEAGYYPCEECNP